MRLKPHWTLVAHGPDEVELRHGVWNAVSLSVTDDSKSGRLFRLIARLQEVTSPERLATDENVPLEEVQLLIDHLLELGAIELNPSTALDHYLESLLPWRAEQEPPANRIALLGDPLLVAEIRRLLSGSVPDSAFRSDKSNDPALAVLASRDTAWLYDGLQFEERIQFFEDWIGSFVVFANKLMDPVRLRLWNRVALAHGIPWLHAAMDGPFLLVGPLIVPRRSACYECLEIRVTMNLREAASYQSYKRAIAMHQVRRGDLPIQPALIGLLASHTALEALNFWLTGYSFTLGKLLAIHLPTMEFSFNEVLRAPTCPACSAVPGRDDTELYFDTVTLLDHTQADALT